MPLGHLPVVGGRVGQAAPVTGLVEGEAHGAVAKGTQVGREDAGPGGPTRGVETPEHPAGTVGLARPVVGRPGAVKTVARLEAAVGPLDAGQEAPHPPGVVLVARRGVGRRDEGAVTRPRVGPGPVGSGGHGSGVAGQAVQVRQCPEHEATAARVERGPATGQPDGVLDGSQQARAQLNGDERGTVAPLRAVAQRRQWFGSHHPGQHEPERERRRRGHTRRRRGNPPHRRPFRSADSVPEHVRRHAAIEQERPRSIRSWTSRGVVR